MHLLSSLAAGFSDAANGTAQIYVRGSSSRAVLYDDFEASTSISSGADLTLNAYGATVIYVNQVVDVIVKDSLGTTVRSYTEGAASGNVEAITQSFTGTDYVTAASAALEPTTLQAILDLWKTNAGSIDWKVLVGGVATTLQNAIGATSGLIFNVKSPEYGAIGDGVVNDQAAFVAAHAAAVAAGGGIVYVPKGTYRITTALSWDHRVALIGVGLGLAILTIDAAAESVLRYTTTNTVNVLQPLKGLKFQASQANSSPQVRAESLAKLHITDCEFGGNANATGRHVQFDVGGSLTTEHCRLTMRSPTLESIYNAPATPMTNFTCRDCTFVSPATFNGEFVELNGMVTFDSCTFDSLTNTTAGTYDGIQMAAGRLYVSGCYFVGSFANAIDMVATSGLAAWCWSNQTNGVLSKYAVTGTLSVLSNLDLDSITRVQSTSTTYTIPNGFRTYEIRSDSTDPTFTMPTGYFPGQRLTVLLRNANGADDWTVITFTGSESTTALAGEPTPVNSGTSAVAEFIWSDLETSGTYVWRKIHAPG